MKFTTRMILTNIVVIIAAIAITTSFAFYRVHLELKQQAALDQESVLKTFWELLRVKGGEFSVANGRLYAGSYQLNDNFDLPDKIKHLDVPYFTAYDPIKNSKGEIIGALYVGIKKSDYFAGYRQMQLAVIAITVLIAIVCSIFFWVMIRRTVVPLIEQLSNMSDRIHAHSGAIAMTMDQQAGFATQLSSSVVEISSTMEEFSSTASQIAQHSQGVVERADKTLEDTKHGASEVENLTFKIMDISGTIQANLTEIVELGRKSKEINKVMEIINNIANQTKLIAFNAALEAASAGEAGKRFGVVAVEIRRLADNVVESTGEIEGKITEILDAVNRLVMSSENSAQLTQEGQEYASHTVAMLIESVDGVDETTSAARQISLSTQQQQIASSQVVIALKDIEQGVRFSTESVHKANVVSGELAALAEQLREMINSFKQGRSIPQADLQEDTEAR